MLYTRKGDEGTTDLADGRRVNKTHQRIECVGTLDEFCSTLGAIIAFVPTDMQAPLKTEIDLVVESQRHLFSIGAWAAAAKQVDRLPDADAIELLEQAIDRIKLQSGATFDRFILPGGHPAAALAHMARTQCRKAERTLLAAGAAQWPSSKQVMPFLNRLSDFLYALAKKINLVAKIEENKW